MPQPLRHPGVYIEEVPSGVRTIVGVATSMTAFIGRTRRGPANKAVLVQSFGEFDRRFGGLWADSTLSYAVSHYFLNGGTDALIVRVHAGAVKATLSLPAGVGTLTLEAADEGAWGNKLRAKVDYKTKDPLTQFNLSVTETGATATDVLRSELFRNLTIGELASVLTDGSALVRVRAPAPADRPNDPTDVGSNNDGLDGGVVGFNQIADSTTLQGPKRGLWALDDVDLFNLLCIPRAAALPDAQADALIGDALTFCEEHRSMLLIDIPADRNTVQEILDWIDDNASYRHPNSALYFPRVRIADPLDEFRLRSIAPQRHGGRHLRAHRRARAACGRRRPASRRRCAASPTSTSS